MRVRQRRSSHTLLCVYVMACQLNHLGVRNLSALQNLVVDQQAKYDFGGRAFNYELTFHCDAPVLTLSSTRSMLHCNCVLPWKPDATTAATALPPVRCWVLFVWRV